MLVNYSSLAKLTLAKSCLHHIGQMQTFFCCDDPVQNEILEFWKLFAMFDDCVQFFAPVCQHQHKKKSYILLKQSVEYR